MNLETNLTQTRTTGADGRFVFLQLPSGRYKVTFSIAGFRTVVQDGIDLTVGQAINLHATAVGVECRGDRHGERDRAGGDDPRGGRQHAESSRDREHADSRTQVRRSADADAGREHRAGARRRRDHVRRPAGHVQQLQPRRRRLQQRLLRRAGRRPARGHRHHPGRREGIPGDRERRARRVRPDGGRRGQRHHEVGHEQRARQRLPFPAARGADRRPVGRQPARRTFIASNSAGPSVDRSSGTRHSSSAPSRGSPATSSVPIWAARSATPCPVATRPWP